MLCGGRDPYALQLLPTHIAAATQLAGAAGGGGGGGGLGGGSEPRTDLFLLGHRLTEEHPDLAGEGEEGGREEGEGGWGQRGSVDESSR